MSPKSFIILGFLTITTLVAAVVMVANDRVLRPVAGAGDPAIEGLLQKANDIGAITIEHNAGTIALTSGAAGWAVKERSGYAARTVKIKRSILSLAQLTLSEPKTRRTEKFAKLELQDPKTPSAQSKLVRLFDRAGTEIGALIVGKRRPGFAGTINGDLYVRKPGDTQTWLATGDADISKKSIDWLERKIVNIDAKRVKRVVLRHPDGEVVTIIKTTPEESLFALDAVPAGKKLLSAMEPTTIGKALVNLVLDDVRTAAAAGPFEAAKTITAEFSTFDGLMVRVRLVERSGAFWLTVEASGNHADAATITARTKGWVYRIADYTASTFTRRMKDLVEDATPKSK
ncbi:MAG: DUF4340 domain-containing protein [Rhodospirillales bacterium]|nr:DUF4340 domain-containing protein [Rhodospirillales bacterium]